MKKIFAILLCALMIVAVPTVAFAEEAPETEETTTVVEVEEKPTITEMLVDYVTSHVEEISVIGTLVVGMFYEITKHKKLNGSIGTLNNNAIAVAENSASAIKSALSGVEDVAKVVNDYKAEFEGVLKEIRKSAEEKKSLEDTLTHVETFLKTAKLATIELSNEVAELLVLANIPNSKKEELYARHKKAVEDIETAEGVINND
jgi:hypothetical protein